MRLPSPQTHLRDASPTELSLSTRHVLERKLLPTLPAIREYEILLEPSGRYAVKLELRTWRARRPNEDPAGAGMYLGSSLSAAPLNASIALLVATPVSRMP